MKRFRFVFSLNLVLLGFLQEPGVTLQESQSNDESTIVGCSIFNFEKSPLEGWTSSGDAFKYQPILEGNGPALNHHGNWFINSSRNMTSPCQPPGNQIGVVAKGTLMSPFFEIRASNLTFLIGGGCDMPTARVELIIDGLTIFKTTGDCKATMTRKFWNTGSHIGKIAQIKIVDDSSAAPWGYVSFDDVRTASGCQELPACQSNHSLCLERSDEHKEVMCRCPSSNVGSLPLPLPCGSSNNCSISGGNCHSICTSADCACQECTCLSGYQFNSSSLRCDDIDECAKNSGGCKEGCVNTLGGYHCTCKKGYCLDKDNKSCADIDECLVDNGGCEHALCTNNLGSFECLCYQGWTKNVSDPMRCVDQDECAGNSLCDPTQTCINTLGSYRCDCQPGYQTDASNKCVDIDECQTLNGGCGHTCTNTVSSFKCSCHNGYRLASDGRNCLDVNECESSNGGCQQDCHNNDGGFECACNPGYRLSNDNVTCIDINECDADSKCTHVCTNAVGGYTCSCRHGYKLHSDNHTCLDVDECGLNNGNCSHKCHNFPGGYNCSCNHGYNLLDNGLACNDVNECLSNNQCQQLCTNSEGSFKCSCISGYKLLDDDKNCQDVDECATKPEELCQHACANTPGSYQCLCPAGYILNADNKTCSDVNECSNNATCQHTCTNLIGSYKCGCFHGYALNSNNRSCTDIDECLQKDICEQQCVNTDGSHHCACSNGYNLAPDKKSCVDVDECQVGKVCQDVCTNTKGSFECSCLDGKVLQSDRKTCKVPVPLNQALESAKKDIKDASSVTALADIVKQVSDSLKSTGSKEITTDELKGTVEVLEQVKSKITNDQMNSTVENAQTLLKNVFGCVNNVLEPNNKDAWKNASGGLTSAIARLTTLLEEMTNAIVNMTNMSENISVEIHNEYIVVLLNVRKLKDMPDVRYKSKSSEVDLNLGELKRRRRSTLLQQKADNDDTVAVCITIFSSLSELMSDTEQAESSTSDVNSDIISVNMMNFDPAYLAALDQPVVLRLKHKKPMGDAQPSCNYINESAANLLSGDVWSTKGCWVNSTQDNVTVCMCNHTTSYGLLMDVHGIYDTLHDTHKEALKYISLIGCSVSICFCVLTVVALTLTMRHPMEKKARYETFRLHINLVVAIGLSQIWFVVGSFLVDVDLVACRVVSIFTHYFLTASFCWMLAEGINVYNKIVKVFSTKKYGKFYFTLGWGFPLVMVIVTSAAVFDKYGPQKICWLHKDVIWVFAVPVMVVIVANFFVLLSVVYVLLRKTMAFSAMPNKPKENPKVKRTVKVTVILLPLLGLTWVFGFLAIDKNFIVFHYLFAIVNSLQGFFIFVAHCWINDSIRSALLEKLPSLPQSSKYRSSTKSGGVGGEGDAQRGSQLESGTYEQDTITASVPMPVHITMSTVQLLNLGKNSPEPQRMSEAINDCMEQDNQLPGFAQ